LFVEVEVDEEEDMISLLATAIRVALVRRRRSVVVMVCGDKGAVNGAAA
jgi:hypothetical protein